MSVTSQMYALERTKSSTFKLSGTVAAVSTHSVAFSANAWTRGLVLLVSKMLTSVPGFKIQFLSFFSLVFRSTWSAPNVPFPCSRFSSIPGQGCQNGATCQNMPGTYQCHCTPGHQQSNQPQIIASVFCEVLYSIITD